MTDQISFDAILPAGMTTNAEDLGIANRMPCSSKDFGGEKTSCGSSTEICRA